MRFYCDAGNLRDSSRGMDIRLPNVRKGGSRPVSGRPGRAETCSVLLRSAHKRTVYVYCMRDVTSYTLPHALLQLSRRRTVSLLL